MNTNLNLSFYNIYNLSDNTRRQINNTMWYRHSLQSHDPCCLNVNYMHTNHMTPVGQDNKCLRVYNTSRKSYHMKVYNAYHNLYNHDYC